MSLDSLTPGCPWYELSELGRPDLDWCEAARCNWIVEPANTWSNLSYIVVALVLSRWSHSHPAGSVLRWFAPCAFLLGLFSFVYHASNTFFFQVFDFVGMFLFFGLALSINLGRLGRSPLGQAWPRVVTTGTLLVFLLRWLGVNIQPIVGVLVLGIVASEAVCRTRRSDEADYRWYTLSLLLFAAASLFSLLDITRTWCEPDNHLIQGHALWHLLSAAAILALYRFYETALAPGGR